MKRSIKILALLGLAALGLLVKAPEASAFSYAKSIIPTSGSTTTTSVLQSTTTSGSALGILTTATDATATYIWDVTPPWSEQVTLRRFVVTYNVAVIAMDAAPTFTVVKQAISSKGLGTTRTVSTLTETESGCGAAVNTTYSCVITLATPVNVLPGETYYLTGAFNQSATSVAFISNVQVRGSGY